MIRVIRSGIGNVIQHFLSIQAVSFRNGEKTNRPKSSLRVDVQALALSTTHINGQLTRYGEGMTELRLPRPKLPK